MDFRELKYICAVAQENNITRAAEKLFMTQPTLSQAIVRTEERIGYKLFTRSSSGLKLTLRGSHFVEVAQLMMQILKATETKIQNIAESEMQQIVIGMSPFWVSLLMPQTKSSFKSKFPNVEIIVREAVDSQLERMLLHEEIQLAVITLPVTSSRIEYDVLFQEKILIAVSCKHPLVEQYGKNILGGYPCLPAESLQAQRFILPQTDMQLRQTVDVFFHANGIIPLVEATTGNMKASQYLAANNIGIAFVPEHFILEQKNHPDLVYFTTDATMPVWVVVIARECSSITTKHMQNFCMTLKNATKVTIPSKL